MCHQSPREFGGGWGMKADPNLDHWNAFDLIFDLGIKSMTAHADDEVFEHIINQSLNYWLLRKFGEIV